MSRARASDGSASRHERRRPAPRHRHGRRRISIVESFNYAVEGIIHVLRTHRNMRIHFAVAVARARRGARGSASTGSSWSRCCSRSRSC